MIKRVCIILGDVHWPFSTDSWARRLAGKASLGRLEQGVREGGRGRMGWGRWGTGGPVRGVETGSNFGYIWISVPSLGSPYLPARCCTPDFSGTTLSSHICYLEEYFPLSPGSVAAHPSLVLDWGQGCQPTNSSLGFGLHSGGCEHPLAVLPTLLIAQKTDGVSWQL